MADAYLRDILEDPALNPAAGTGEVASFYAGCNVLITGASGFLGKLSTEKILRSCSDVNTLFLLLRAKKGKTPAERFEELFDDVIFDRLKKEKPEFSRKVMLIEGDMAEADLGLSLENRELLRTTHIVLHGADTVRFVEKLRVAANINLRGVQELLFLAKEMPNLKQKVNSTGSPMVSKDEESPMIYNAVSSSQKPIKWGQFMMYTEEYGMSIPSTMCLWYYCFRLNKYRWVHNLSVIFLHFIPAAIVDSLAWLTGRKPTLWATYKRIHKFSSVIEFFMLHQWRFDNTNVQELWKRLSPAGRSEFDLDIGSIDWRDYCFHQVRGLRIYLLKDPLDTLPQGHAKYARLKVAHYTLVTAACGILLWLVWTVGRFIGLW